MSTMADKDQVLRDFLALTWWVEAPGVTIRSSHPSRSGSEVRELINLRSAANRALAKRPRKSKPNPLRGTP